jgi:hypothetical protein
MPGIPRIVREQPKGPKVTPEVGIPALARIRWHHGHEPVVPVTLLAWTSKRRPGPMAPGW